MLYDFRFDTFEPLDHSYSLIFQSRQFLYRVGFNGSRIEVLDTPKRPTLGQGLQEQSDRAIVSSPTVRSRPNSRDMCPRHVKTSRNSRIGILKSWTPRGPGLTFWDLSLFESRDTSRPF
ncbi:hypothetical protein L3X38_037034 [Prunus dulcis]|uniref:Uncharacterized protein n=1 Tax=Prunus dulcis TaxID=3755 RepID=A0AAD4V4P2_PRUDU|nr:hypothetical protein L3X38_037034 [Prunus dulcis]